MSASYSGGYRDYYRRQPVLVVLDDPPPKEVEGARLEMFSAEVETRMEAQYVDIWPYTPLPPPPPCAPYPALDDFLARVKMRPGWTLARVPDAFTRGYVVLKIETWVDNTYHPGRGRPLAWYVHIIREDGVIDIANKVMDAIMFLEEHEHAEWLKLDGKPVFDPHPPGYQHGRNEGGKLVQLFDNGRAPRYGAP